MTGINEPKAIRRCLLVLLTATLVAGYAAALRSGLWEETAEVIPAGILSQGGSAYAFEFGPSVVPSLVFGRQSDTNERPRQSSLRLFEDGVAIGAAHSVHQDIHQQGRGRFSHWQTATDARSSDTLIFSASDDSDPRNNGRSYGVQYRLEFGSLGLAVIALLWFASLAVFLTVVGFTHPRALGATRNALRTLVYQAAHSPIWTVAVVGAAAYVLWFFGFAMPNVPLLNPDSHTYLTANAIVPLGYWAFAKLVALPGNGLTGLPAAQIGVWIASVLVLYQALHIALKFRAVAALCAIALLLLGTVTKYSMFALTEVIYASSLLLHLSAVILVLERATRLRLAMVGVTALLVILIRPAGFFVPVCTLLLFVYRFRHRRMIALATIVPMVAGFAVVTLASNAYRGTPAQSIAWLALFPHVGHLYRVEDLAEPHAAATAVAAALEDYRRDQAAQASPVERALYSMNNFNRASAATQSALRNFGFRDREEMIPYYREFATSSITHHPLAYASHVADHVFTAWWIHFPYAANTEKWLNEHFQAFEQSHNTLARKLAETVHVPEFAYGQLISAPDRTLQRDSSTIDMTLRVLVQVPLFGPLVAIASLITLLASLVAGRRWLWLAVAGYVGAMMHGAIVLTALATTVIPRYVDPIVPLAIVFIAVWLDRACVVALAASRFRVATAELITAPARNV
ncbi:MAG TPA: hypothetical protein VNA44_06160 [Burkholderiaceae bacterium]|nr:hypothetical protein [Burkholderiaceae bacterium]